MCLFSFHCGELAEGTAGAAIDLALFQQQPALAVNEVQGDFGFWFIEFSFTFNRL